MNDSADRDKYGEDIATLYQKAKYAERELKRLENMRSLMDEKIETMHVDLVEKIVLSILNKPREEESIP